MKRSKQRPWTEEDDNEMAELRVRGLTWEQVARKIKRTLGACSQRSGVLRRGRPGKKRKTVTLVTGQAEKTSKPKHLNSDVSSGIQSIIDGAINTAREDERKRIVKSLRDLVEAL